MSGQWIPIQHYFDSVDGRDADEYAAHYRSGGKGPNCSEEDLAFLERVWSLVGDGGNNRPGRPSGMSRKTMAKQEQEQWLSHELLVDQEVSSAGTERLQGVMKYRRVHTWQLPSKYQR